MPRFGITFDNLGQAEAFFAITNARLKQNQGTPEIISDDPDFVPVLLDKDYTRIVENVDAPPPGLYAILADDYIEEVTLGLLSAGEYPGPIEAELQAKIDLNGLLEDISNWNTDEEI